MPVASGHDYADFFPRRSNAYVANLVYDANVTKDGIARMELGQPVAAGTNGIINAFDVTAGVTKGGVIVSSFNPDKSMGRYGRNVVLAVSAGTPTVTVYGRDYLGQPMSEQFAAAGAGKKAFWSVDNITSTAAAGNVSLGWGTVLGLPYATLKLNEEWVDDVAPAAGTFVAANATQTATSTDPRGTYAPAGAVAPNGVRNIVVIGRVLQGNLHGARHYST